MDLNTQQEVHLSHYWNVIRKRWKVAVAILIVVMIGTFLASYFSTPLYRSQIRIEIEREGQAVTLEDLFGIAASDQEFLQTQYVLLKSRVLAVRVIEEHKLLNDPQFYPQGIAGKKPEEVRQIAEGMAGALLGGIVVEPVRNTRLVDIYYTGTSPTLSQKVAEAWGESFMHMNVARKLESVAAASEFLVNQIAAVQADLEQSRRQLQQYSESKNIISVGEGSGNVTLQKLDQLNADVTRTQNMYFEKQAKYNSTRNTPADTIAGGDARVAQIDAEISRLQREQGEKRSQYLEQHPVMRQLADQIAKAQSQRATAVRNAYAKAVEDARAEMNAAAASLASVRAEYERARQEAQRLNIDAARYNDLRVAVTTKENTLAQLQKQLNETQVTARLRGSASSNVHWVDHAVSPGYRVNLSMTRNLQTAFPLGLILGLAAIFFLEYMDRSLKTPEDLERLTGFASLGVIPAAGSVSKQYGYAYGYGRTAPRLRAVEAPDAKQGGIDLLPHIDARSPISEAYRAFRTSLLLASASSPKVIVITSSFAREGKTTTSVNLATVLAQMGKPVLLVDADLRRPRLQKVFPGLMNLGLVNYLAANIPVDDTIQATQVPNLSVMLAGPIPPNPSELLASDRMKHLIEELRGDYAYVIFDSPPVLAVTDAVVLATNADGVVLCVHGGQTPRELVQRSAERLRQANIPVLGAILNNLDLHQYGYTYRKGYYDYYESTEDGDEGAATEARKTR
jgi:polysaccharide biosynthesis transport protein